VDVVIVGGGITGAIASYLFSNAGVRVALVEAKDCGRGSTAASTALLMQEPDRDFVDLVALYGPAATRRIWKALGRATRDLASTIRRLRIDCDLHERESVYFTLDPEMVPSLQREFRKRRAAGLPGRWLSPRALYKKAGIMGQAAIATPGNAQVDPFRACRGFLDAASARGAKIFERSPVRRIATTREGVSVRTPGGVIEAKYVLVATGYATPDFKPLAGRFRMKNTYVIATSRLPKSTREKMLGARVMLWDTDRPYHYLRWTDDGRLLVGGNDTDYHRTRGSRKRIATATERLLAYLARVCPTLVGGQAEYAWEGLFAETPDGLPYVGTHRRYPRHLFALGYGGNGMTASFLAARLLLRRYRERPDPEESLFSFSR
jgi:glycine/D-amino acid oxidase-like deaminating enzyme